MHGSIPDSSNDMIVAWVEYGKNGTFELSTSKANTYGGSRNFSGYAYGLKDNTTYSYRAVA
jgi:hypothetical protein